MPYISKPAANCIMHQIQGVCARPLRNVVAVAACPAGCGYQSINLPGGAAAAAVASLLCIYLCCNGCRQCFMSVLLGEPTKQAVVDVGSRCRLLLMLTASLLRKAFRGEEL